MSSRRKDWQGKGKAGFRQERERLRGKDEHLTRSHDEGGKLGHCASDLLQHFY